MKNELGTETTTIQRSTLTEAIKSLTEGAERVFCNVLLNIDSDSLLPPEKRFHDERGIEIITNHEFESENIQELKNSGLVMIHEDSDHEISFLSVNKDVFYEATKLGIYRPFDFSHS